MGLSTDVSQFVNSLWRRGAVDNHKELFVRDVQLHFDKLQFLVDHRQFLVDVLHEGGQCIASGGLLALFMTVFGMFVTKHVVSTSILYWQMNSVTVYLHALWTFCSISRA